MADTRFKPGQSGNPSGRPKGHNEFRDELRKLSPKVVKRLKTLVSHRDPSIALQAMKLCIEHAWGRPAQQIEVKGAVGAHLDGELVIRRRRADGSTANASIPGVTHGEPGHSEDG